MCHEREHGKGSHSRCCRHSTYNGSVISFHEHGCVVCINHSHSLTHSLTHLLARSNSMFQCHLLIPCCALFDLCVVLVFSASFICVRWHNVMQSWCYWGRLFINHHTIPLGLKHQRCRSSLCIQLTYVWKVGTGSLVIIVLGPADYCFLMQLLLKA